MIVPENRALATKQAPFQVGSVDPTDFAVTIGAPPPRAGA